MSHALPKLIAGTLACFALVGAGVAHAGAVLSNGTVELGVNDAGQLNFGNRGVYFVATAHDGTRAGCPCEGWGAGNQDADEAKRFSGFANQSEGIVGVGQESFESTSTTATSVANVGEGRLRVRHEFAPFAGSENLFEVTVTLTNTTEETLGDVRYTRLMDWDIEPTPFQEFVTVRRGTTPKLLFSNDNGFTSNDPLRSDPPSGQPGTENVDFTDVGPSDHGALFDFGFGALLSGESVTFKIFYGAAATTAEADGAILASGAEVFTYGKPNAGGVANDNLNTFIFAFRDLGGDPVIPRILALTPQTATNALDAPHTITANLRDVNGAVADAPVVFAVTGANPRDPSPATTDADGTATFSYTGALEGVDTITACVDDDADGACGASETTATATNTYDGTPPQTTIGTGPADGGRTADSTPGFALISNEPGSSFECRVDEGEAFACTSPVTLDALEDGAHSLAVTATDGVGNTDASPVVRTFTVDTVAPQTTMDLGPVEGATTTDSTPAFEFSSDEPGSTFRCRIDGGGTFACESPFTPNALSLGEHSLSVTASDSVGNADLTPVVRTFSVDATPPQTTFTAGPVEGAAIADNTPTFGFSSDEAGSSLECSIDGGVPFACESPFTADELSDGEHALSVTATDGFGNPDASPAVRTFTVDTTPPQTTIDTGPAEGATVTDNTPRFGFSSDDAGSTFGCRIDGGEAFACESPFTPDELSDGEHALSVTAADGLGNTDASPAVRTFTVDTTPPQTTIDTGPAEGATVTDNTPAFGFSSDEPGSTFECSIDGGGTFACESPFTPDELSDGEHALSVSATDGAGHPDLTAAVRTFVIDTGDPQTTIDLGPDEGSTTTDTTPAFEFSSDAPGSRFECSIDGGEAFACASPFTPDELSDGEHSLSVTAYDNPGNRDDSPAVRTFTVDTTGPQTAVQDGPQDGATTADSTPAFRFSSGEPGSTFQCRIDGGEPFACESPYTPTALADGEHTFAVTATDASGNQHLSPTVWRFTVDTTPAVIAPALDPVPAPAAVTLPGPPAADLISCISRRRFHITLRPARVRLVSAVVRVNHKRVAIRKSSRRLRATVDMRGLPRGVYTVTIDARDAKRRHYYETRRYRVC